MLSRVFASFSILSSLGLLLPLVLDRPLIQSLLVSFFLLFNAFVSALVFPSIELTKPWLFVPQLFASVLVQLLSLCMMMCAVMELDGQKTILSSYQPNEEWWESIGVDFTIGCLVLWSLVFLIGNFVTFIHFRTFAALRKRMDERPRENLPPLPPPYTLFTLQPNGRPDGAPPSYDQIFRKEYTIQDLPR
ncbi:hypothetical protein PMAYCL1PPCAC_12476 [Pristionchus mayeri]|uniref:Uncharacterized protein n=1 Tax=Pristionchus mayeri TaxID=1317129 RepID=A0AAN4ZNP6_9BILA|nr:hypothetical protein PMAYCL1PPCAC_12476 [Pristionchus mayeri]